MLGVVTKGEAISAAAAEGLDVVVVNASSDPPVCRIMDFGRSQYRRKKRMKQQHLKDSRKQKQLRLTHRTDDNDIDLLIHKAKRFLEQNHSVRFNLVFRGRDRNHFERGKEMISRIEKSLQEHATMQNVPKREARLLSVNFVPKRAPSS